MIGSYRTFPPKWGNLLIPTSSRPAALAGVAMYAPSKQTGIWVQRIAWVGIRLFGPKVLPFSAEMTDPLLAGDTWSRLSSVWRKRLGEFDAVAIHHKAGPHRMGFGALLLDEGRPLAFVKLRSGDESSILEQEHRALEMMWAQRPTAFRVMRPLELGEVDGWCYSATAPLPPRMHRAPKQPLLTPIISEIAAGLAGLSRPAGTPDHWVPMHGDFTPWNLRDVPGLGLTLLDWETTGWAPPFSDLVMYQAAEAALRGQRSARFDRADGALDEARAYWHAHWSEKIERHRGLNRDAPVDEKALAPRMRRILEDST